MFEYSPSLQKAYTRLFRGAAWVAHEKLHLTPNALSILSFLVVLLGLILFATQHLEAALIVTLIGFLLDGLDGSVARMYNMQTRTGFYFEMIFDGIHELLLYPSLAIGGYIEWNIALTSVGIFLILRIWKFYKKDIFDPGFKRVSVLFGYLIAFDFVAVITLLWATFGIFVNTLLAIQKKIPQLKARS